MSKNPHETNLEDEVLNRLAKIEDFLAGIRANQTRKIILPDSNNVNRILLDGETGQFKISDPTKDVLTAALADLAFSFDPATGDITVHGDPVNTNSEVFSDLNLEHWFTPVNVYEAPSGTSFQVDGDNFKNQTVFLEANMLVEQAGRTAFCRLFNETDGNALASSEITTTLVGNLDPIRVIFTNWDLVRSSALTFPSGNKKYKLQVRQSTVGGGGDQAHFYIVRLVMTQK